MANTFEYIRLGNKGRILTHTARNFTGTQEVISEYSDAFREEQKAGLITALKISNNKRVYDFNLADLDKISGNRCLVDITETSVIKSVEMPVFLTDLALQQILHNLQFVIQETFPDINVSLDKTHFLVTRKNQYTNHINFNLLAPALNENDGVIVRENFKNEHFKMNFVSNTELTAYITQLQISLIERIRKAV